MVNEVITEDTYRLQNMKREGFEPETIVSVGSHIGTFEVLAHALWPKARLISVEPNKESFAVLQQNAPFASAYNAAISYKEHGVLIDGERSSGGGFIASKEEFEQTDGYDPATGLAPEDNKKGWSYHIADSDIRCMTFEELVRAERLTRIDLLKLDCEGGEWDILEHLPMPGLEIGYVVGEWHGLGEYRGRNSNDFVAAARTAFPHLTFHGLKPHEGDHACPWGPFFSFPGSAEVLTEQPRSHTHTPFLKRLKRSIRKRLSED
jgi:FkbM family methyltransferase